MHGPLNVRNRCGQSKRAFMTPTQCSTGDCEENHVNPQSEQSLLEWDLKLLSPARKSVALPLMLLVKLCGSV